MDRLNQRVIVRNGVAMLRRCRVSLAEIQHPLEEGATLRQVADSVGCSADALLDALVFLALGPEGSDGPSLVASAPRFPKLKDALSEPALEATFSGTTKSGRLVLAAGLLQIHDFWDASHDAAQAADDLGERDFSAYWHGIAHRREPDPGNAAYWFRRVGRHPVFSVLEREAVPLLDDGGNAFGNARLMGAKGWDAFAMIDLCSTAGSGSALERLARRLQRLEMRVLIGETAWATLPHPHLNCILD